MHQEVHQWKIEAKNLDSWNKIKTKGSRKWNNERWNNWKIITFETVTRYTADKPLETKIERKQRK